MAAAHRKRHYEIGDRMEVKARFNDFAESLEGEGFPEDEVTDGMIRALCRRIGDPRK